MIDALNCFALRKITLCVYVFLNVLTVSRIELSFAKLLMLFVGLLSFFEVSHCFLNSNEESADGL